jgi:hypothetical protein
MLVGFVSTYAIDIGAYQHLSHEFEGQIHCEVIIIIKFYLKSILIKHITTQALMSFSNRLHTKYMHSSHNHARTHQYKKKNDAW